MRRNLPLLSLLIVQGAFTAIIMLLRGFGDASAANDLLSFLTPEARAVVMSDGVLISMLILSYLGCVFLAVRDAGQGAKALRTIVELEKQLKEANQKAWSFEPQFIALKEKIEANDQTILDALTRVEKREAELAEIASAGAERVLAFEREQREILQNMGIAHNLTAARSADEAAHRINCQVIQMRESAELKLQRKMQAMHEELRASVGAIERRVLAKVETLKDDK